MFSPFPTAPIVVFLLTGLGFLLLGGFMLARPDSMWTLAKRRYDTYGIVSQRTEVWERANRNSGIAIVVMAFGFLAFAAYGVVDHVQHSSKLARFDEVQIACTDRGLTLQNQADDPRWVSLTEIRAVGGLNGVGTAYEWEDRPVVRRLTSEGYLSTTPSEVDLELQPGEQVVLDLELSTSLTCKGILSDMGIATPQSKGVDSCHTFQFHYTQRSRDGGAPVLEIVRQCRFRE
jgi:hypothetical protein